MTLGRDGGLPFEMLLISCFEIRYTNSEVPSGPHDENLSEPSVN